MLSRRIHSNKGSMRYPEERKEPMASLFLRVHTKARSRPQRLRGKEDMLIYQPWQMGTAYIPSIQSLCLRPAGVHEGPP